MPNDAKLGLVIGIGLVITIAVVFGRKDTPTATGQTVIVSPAESVPGSAQPVARPGPATAGTVAQPAPTWYESRPSYGFASETQTAPGGK